MADTNGVRKLSAAKAMENLREADAALLAASKSADRAKLRAAAILFGRADSHARAAKLREVTSSVLEGLDTPKK